MARLLAVVLTVLFASVTALGAPVHYSAAAVEKMRAQGRSEYDIAVSLGATHPSPAFVEAPVPHPRLRPQQRLVRDRSGDVVPAPRDAGHAPGAPSHRASSLAQSIASFIRRFLKSSRHDDDDAAAAAAVEQANQERADRNRRGLSWEVGKGRPI